MAGWLDNIFSNLPPGKPLPGSPRRPKLPDNTPLMPVDPREVVGGLMDQGAQGVGHAIDYATGQPVGEGFSQPTLGREVYQMLTSPTFGGGASPVAGASTLAVAPLAARAVQASKGARSAEEIATGAKAATEDAGAVAGPLARARAAAQADADAQAARAAQASPGQAALDRLTGAAPTPSATEVATGAKALPKVTWDADQQRWLTANGKPITSAPLTIPEGGPSYPNLFDPNDPKLAQRPAGVEQFDLPRGSMTRGPAVSPRVADLVGNEDVRKQVMEYVQQGSDIGDRWYNTSPIQDSAVRALGADAGQQAYQKYMGFVGATSPQQKFPPNLRGASYYYWRDVNDLPPLQGRLQGGTETPPPLYGHYVQGAHMQNVEKVTEAGYDPTAAYNSEENPKPPSFNQDLLGNYSPVAVDMHAFKLPAMLSRDPRFLATGVPKGAPGYPDFNPREAVTSGQVSMDEAFKNPTWWDDAPNPKNEYPAMEQYWKGMAADLQKDPAQAQAGGWIGGGGVTGLGSPPETAAQAFQNRINNTAYRTGSTQSEAENNFWRGVHPLLGVAGGAGLATPLVQQYLASLPQPGATGQGGAPDAPRYW